MDFQTLTQRSADLTVKLDAIEAAAKDNEGGEFTDDQRTEYDKLVGQQEQVAGDLSRVSRRMAAERAIPAGAGVVAGRIELGVDHATEQQWGPVVRDDMPADVKLLAREAALGAFAIAVKDAMSGHGSDPRLFATASGMGTAVDSEGGFAIPMEVATGIERDMFTAGALLSLVDARTITGNAIAYNVLNETSRADGSRQGGILGYWVDEGTPPTATKGQLARVEMKLRKVGTLGYSTDELLADQAALGAELQAMFAEELIFQVEAAITEGVGGARPIGYLKAACLVTQAKETGQAAASIVTSNISKMWSRMRPRDKATSVWLVNGDVTPQLDVLTTPGGLSDLEPRFVTYSADGVIRIKGRPVVETEYNATIGSLGDFVLINPKKYRLIRKGGVDQASSMHVRFTQGEQTFRAFYRVDGQMMPRSAVTPYKGGSTKTLSPVVVLAARP